MKDTRFIELVNQYVDRQISPAETAELEAEIQASPRHRKIYQQYCHMHRATKLVYESFRANAEQPAGEIAHRGGSVAQFEHSRSKNQWPRWSYSAAGLAAAACFAVILAHNGTFSHADSRAVAAQPAATPLVAVAMPAATVSAALTETTKPTVLAEQQNAAQLSAKRQEEMRAYALSQQHVVKPIMLFADNAFEEKPILPSENEKIFRLKSKPDSGPATAFAAFQFQR